MPACLAKNVTEKLAGTVCDDRLISEFGRTGHVYDDFDDPRDHIEIAGQVSNCRQSIERSDACTVDRLIHGDFGAYLSNGS